MGGKALGKLFARDRERCGRRRAQRLRVRTQIGDDGIRLVLPDRAAERLGRHAGEGLEIGKVLAQGRIGTPDAFARNGILERQTANIGRKRPTVFRWKMLKALHGRAVEPLVATLIKTKKRTKRK